MIIIFCVCIILFESIFYKILFKCLYIYIGGFNYRVKSLEYNNVIKVFVFWCIRRIKLNKIVYSDMKVE